MPTTPISIYPPENAECPVFSGVFPVDFILESILTGGLEWFRTASDAPNLVFEHLKAPWLNERYGQAKIDEIAAYIRKYQIPVVQSWALIADQVPCISIQLLDGSEATERAALADHAGEVDVLDASDAVLGRTNIGYSPIVDAVHIGIHNINTPDLTKYLYSLVVYILSSFRPEFEKRGLLLGTFRATDVSRLNEYLPENMYSRFINFTCFSTARFSKGCAPIIEKIIGLSVAPGPSVLFDESSDTGISETGITVTETDT